MNMRELADIKVRVKCVDDNWYVFNMAEVLCNSIRVRVTYHGTIGQFTGLIDKNDKEIYEGDIVMGVCVFGDNIPAVVEFSNGAFGVKWDNVDEYVFTPFTSFCNVKWEVIGNIHDNPELLEKL